jgi:prohibitin 2
MKNNSEIFGIILIVFMSFILLAGVSSCTTVGTGEVGVLKTVGKVTGDTFSAGLNWKNPIPFYQTVDKVDTRIKKETVKCNAVSKDLQNIETVVALNYSVLPNRAVDIIKNIGDNYKDVIVDPNIQEAVKQVTAKYSTENLINKRAAVAIDIDNVITNKISPYGLRVESINIVNFKFSSSYANAIEQKQTAQQDTLKSKQLLEKQKIDSEKKVVEAKAEAEATLTRAKAEAEALRLQKQEISPDLLKLRAIEKWNGTLPTYQAGGGEIINLK